MKGDEGPLAEQMAPHTRQKDPQVTEGCADREMGRNIGSWVDGTGSGQSTIAVAGSASLLSALASSAIERQAFRGIETHELQPCLGN